VGVKQTINLTGISPGSANKSRTVALKAASSNTQVIPQPVVNYTSPSSSGVLTFTPAAAGTSIISVSATVSIGSQTNYVTTQRFGVTVVPAGSTAPRITGQPTNQIALAGQNVTLSVAVTGAAPLKYQWQCNTCVLPSATNAALNLSNVTTNQTGLYKVTVSNGLGETNTTAALSVYPTLAATLASATPPSRGQFAMTINGVTGYKYVVQTSSNMMNWVSIKTNNAPFTFVDTNAARFSQRFYRSFYLP